MSIVWVRILSKPSMTLLGYTRLEVVSLRHRYTFVNVWRKFQVILQYDSSIVKHLLYIHGWVRIERVVIWQCQFFNICRLWLIDDVFSDVIDTHGHLPMLTSNSIYIWCFKWKEYWKHIIIIPYQCDVLKVTYNPRMQWFLFLSLA